MKNVSPKNRPVVAHMVHKYLGISETFIFHTVAHPKQFESLVLTHGARNLALFPVTNLYDTARIKKFSWPWVLNYLDYFLCNREYFFEFRSHFRKILRRSGARLIHAHFAPEGLKALFFKESLGLPVVTSFYGYDMSSLPKNGGWLGRLKRLFEVGDLFLVEGPHMAKELQRIGCPDEKIRIVPIGVNLAGLPFSERFPELQREKVRIVFCGRFVEKKGLQYALEGIEIVKDSYPYIEFRIIGDGEERQGLETFVQRNGLSEVATFLGYKTHPEVIEEMARAQILLQPSVTARDGDSEGGAPVILLEAQAMGLPVVSTFHADIPNIVANGKSGVLVPERDPSALAEALINLISHPQRWPQMGRHGRAYVENHHDINKVAEKLETYYGQLIHK